MRWKRRLLGLGVGGSRDGREGCSDSVSEAVGMEEKAARTRCRRQMSWDESSRLRLGDARRSKKKEMFVGKTGNW